jgi:alkanesulfonate monooxygenase SsuD/methylene tetrahydromethanopterin reductase-like flavin-dependent oxidoreductase (luciferase family)
MIDIGRVGLWTGLLDAHPTSRVRELAVELEEMGWPCLWRPETSGRDAFVSAAQILEATTTLKVATGIAQIHARHPLTTRNAQRTLHEASGGRFLLGLGVSHAPFIEAVRKVTWAKPYTEMVEYLAAMEQAPFMAVGTPTSRRPCSRRSARRCCARGHRGAGCPPVLLARRAHRLRPGDDG